MKQVTPNVYVESGIPVCNLGLITTKEGIVMIDVPFWPSGAVKWREEVSKRGKPCYLINTEEHPDHCQNSWFFTGVLITSQETKEKLSKVSVAEVKERVKHGDPGGLSLMESFQVRLADITFTGSMDLYLGDHTFKLFPLPGHSTGGIGVYIPQERVVFTTDCVFHQLKTWLQDADPDQWLESLRKIGDLDVDFIVPGHGAICKKDYLKEQASIIQQWVEAVKSAINQGLSEDEAVAKVSSPDPYPPQQGIPLAASELNKMIIVRLYRLYSS